MPNLEGNFDELVSILSRMSTVVLVLLFVVNTFLLLLLLTNFAWHTKEKRKLLMKRVYRNSQMQIHAKG